MSATIRMSIMISSQKAERGVRTDDHERLDSSQRRSMEETRLSTRETGTREYRENKLTTSSLSSPD